MSTHQDIVPEPHTRTSKRIPEIVKDKVFIQGIPMEIPDHLSTNAEHLQDLNPRTF